MLDAIKSANIANNILILKDLFYLEGVVAHGRASSSLAFGTSSQQGPQSFSIAGLFCVPWKAWAASPVPSAQGNREMTRPGDVGHQQPGARVLEQFFLRG